MKKKTWWLAPNPEIFSLQLSWNFASLDYITTDILSVDRALQNPGAYPN
jgi:hypothetical protein